jgi:hypothetical protein
VPADNSDRNALIEWARAGEGDGLPSLLWPDLDINDALIGGWPDEYGSEQLAADHAPVDFKFEERGKGIPLL